MYVRLKRGSQGHSWAFIDSCRCCIRMYVGTRFSFQEGHREGRGEGWNERTELASRTAGRPCRRVLGVIGVGDMIMSAKCRILVMVIWREGIYIYVCMYIYVRGDHGNDPKTKCPRRQPILSVRLTRARELGGETWDLQSVRS